MIKKLILLLFFIHHSATVFSQKQTLFIDTNYNTSLTLSKVEKKPMVIFFYAPWCPHCNKMKNEVFTDSTVTSFYRKNFVCVLIDATSSYGKELKAKFQNTFKVGSFPTFAFLDSNENLLYCAVGELKKEAFLSEGNNVLLPENQLPYLKNSFNNDPSNSDKCLKYITSVRKAGLDATSITQKYFSTKTESERFTEPNWKVFSNGINNFDCDEFKFVIKNKEAFYKVVSPTRVDKKIIYTVSENLRPLVEALDTINYDNKRLIAKSFNMQQLDSLLYRFDIQILSGTSNWKKYQKITSDNVEKFSWNDTVLLYDICNTYLHDINDKNGLLQAINWGKYLLSKGESIDKYVLMSQLFTKVKDYKQAQEFAQKGKIFATNLKFKSDQFDLLLEETKKHIK
ncbi:thioredoxin family protein [Flavobacterium sp.]|uniref:thioredoxin family protein n=1 Tax=Flavobacterium sp. TaxID=239 RepID=UPI0025DB819C|nr:thioredoxin family protein [Flavobacterium sp.]